MSTKNAVIDGNNIDHSALIGQEVRLKTEQFPGRVLNSRIVSVSGGNLVLDRSGSAGLINQLIGNQNITITLKYKSEQVVFSSTLSKPNEGRIQIPIANTIFPETRRRFVRLPLGLDVRLTFFDDSGISSTRLSKLRWFRTRTVNVGGGGVLVELPVNLSEGYFMILHLEIEDFDVPVLMLGDVRHCRAKDNNYYSGVEFILKENYRERLPKVLVRNLPPKIFDFDIIQRKNLAAFLAEKYGK
jgi:c-di-GMP-binding flagellar brake protein YcgR